MNLLGRAVTRVAAAFGFYRAADRGRLNDIPVRNRSADANLLPQHMRMIGMGRWMAANNPYVRAILSAKRRNLIGTGISGSAAATDAQGNLLTDLNRRIDTAFFDWAINPRLVDIEGRRNWVQVQHWFVSELMLTGGGMAIMSSDPRRIKPRAVKRIPSLVLQLVEYEQLDRELDTYNGNQVRGGVEIDEFGAPVAYHIKPRHPNDINNYGSDESKRIEAWRVVHLFDPERARQTVGAPNAIASIIDLVNSLSEMHRAHVMAARAEANQVMHLKRTMDAPQIGQTGEQAAREKEVKIQASMAEPMTILEIPEGYDAQITAQSRSSGNYEPFIRISLRTIASAAGLSYEQLLRDFSTTNYSGNKMGSNEDRRENSVIVEQIYWHVCQRVREQFIRLGVEEGIFNIPDYNDDPDRYTYTEWRAQGYESVDPGKDNSAVQQELEMGLTTLQIECAKKNRDWREIIAQRKVELEAQRQAGLLPTEQVTPAESATAPVEANV